MGGSLDDVLSDLYTIEEAAEQLGLSLNHKKSEIVCSDPMVKREMLSVSPDFHSVDPADACLLGAPIGERDSIDAVLKQKLDEMKLMGERLQVLFSHDALCLLTNAFSLPKILYTCCVHRLVFALPLWILWTVFNVICLNQFVMST